MKKICTLFALFVLLHINLLAQAPQAFNYQGVARNAQGQPFSSQAIQLRLSIRINTPDGTVVYSETRNLTTSAFGLFSVQVGSPGATTTQGDFTTINWNGGPRFLQTEFKTASQADFTDLGTVQMASVPYAINSLQARQLSFPFDTTVNTNVENKSAFKVRNTSFGPFEAITGESVNGYGVYGVSDKSHGVYGVSKLPSKSGVYGFSTAEAGYGVMGSVAQGNISSIGVYGKATSGIGVRGESVGKEGVEGRSTNSAGVSGVSVNHHGVVGMSEEPGKAGVYGSGGIGSFNQAGVLGEAVGSSTGMIARNTDALGLALSVEGRLKISGTGQQPGAGKVLTSDGSGNASWQAPTVIAFRASGLLNEVSVTIPYQTYKKILFYQSARYNIGNAYDANSSMFFAPLAGIYHFEVTLGNWNSSEVFSKTTYLKLLRNGQISVLGQQQTGTVSLDIRLEANDAVWVEVYHYSYNNNNQSQNVSFFPVTTWFTGHLVTKL